MISFKACCLYFLKYIWGNKEENSNFVSKFQTVVQQFTLASAWGFDHP